MNFSSAFLQTKLVKHKEKKETFFSPGHRECTRGKRAEVKVTSQRNLQKFNHPQPKGKRRRARTKKTRIELQLFFWSDPSLWCARTESNRRPSGHEPDELPLLYWRWPMVRRTKVVQPHLPVRLPCYDFTLVTSPSFGAASPSCVPLRPDRSPHQRLLAKLEPRETRQPTPLGRRTE